MYQLHVIEIKRTFIGAAVAASDGFWFRAVHPRAEDLDGRHWMISVGPQATCSRPGG